jgi:F-type H+-transporting ATPase subunit a
MADRLFNWLKGLPFFGKVTVFIAAWLIPSILLLLIFGNDGKNEEFKPQDEFKLHDWIPIHLGPLNLSINRAVLYLVLAGALTIWVMVYIARHMQLKPNRTQAAVEAAYDVTKNNITGTNLPSSYATKWFPFLATLFFFIAFSNLIGYLPLPTNSAETVDLFGLSLPTFAIFAATANISFALALTLVVWFSYHI